MAIVPNCTWPATLDPADVFDALSELCELTRRPAWHRDAACRGHTDLFFPIRGQAIEPAKAICTRCLVRDECLAAALEMGDGGPVGAVGVWGGTSARERKKLRRPRIVSMRRRRIPRSTIGDGES